MKHIMYKTDDGIGISIPGASLRRRFDNSGFPEEDMLYHLRVKHHNRFQNTEKVITEDDYPKDENGNVDRYFRSAWEDVTPDTKINVNLTKARTFHMDKIRKQRDKKLDELDKEYLKDPNDNVKANDIAAQKQALRDLPSNTDLSTITNLQQLKKVWPAILN